MKISVWTQFSSNHSAGFTLVGKFDTTQRAREVVDEIRTIVREIAQWWEDQNLINWLEYDELWNKLAENNQLTPPEEKYSAKYQVEWRNQRWRGTVPLDWTLTLAAENDVRLYQNYIIIEPYADTWAGTSPFEQILKKLGGQVLCTGEAQGCDDHWLFVVLTCIAPNTKTAETLESEAHTFVERGESALTLPDLYPVRGSFQREGDKLTYRYQLHSSANDKWLKEHRPERGEDYRCPVEDKLDDLIEYVRRHGCTNIQYKLVEAR